MEHSKLIELNKKEKTGYDGGAYIVGLFAGIRSALRVVDDLETFLDGFEEGYSNTCNCKN